MRLLISILFILILNVPSQNLYKNDYSLTPLGQISLKMDQKTLQVWTLPQEVKDNVMLDFPRAQLSHHFNQFEICLSDNSQFILREFNSRLILIDKGKCQWNP